MKTYVLMLSKTFPAYHPCRGEDTLFKDKFLLGQGCKDCNEEQDLSGENISECNGCLRACFFPKIHTIRNNYDLWEKRISEIQAGRAVLSVRQWIGMPYRSKTIEIARLTAEDGVGIEKLSFGVIELGDNCCTTSKPLFVNGRRVSMAILSKNDGLSIMDWYYWLNLKGCRPYREPMAIIHFTPFRY